MLFPSPSPFSFPRNSKKLWYNLFEAVCTRLGILPSLCGTTRARVYAMTCFLEQHLPEVLSFSIYLGVPGSPALLPFPFSNLSHSSLASFSSVTLLFLWEVALDLHIGSSIWFRFSLLLGAASSELQGSASQDSDCRSLEWMLAFLTFTIADIPKGLQTFPKGLKSPFLYLH